VAKRGVLRGLIDRLSFRSRTPIVVPAETEVDEWQPPGQAKTVTEMPASAPAAAKGTITVTSAEDYVATLDRRFVPSAAKGIDAVFQWELTGEGGQTFHAVVRDGGITVLRGAHDKPTVTLEMGASDYVKVINGELDGMKAFASGKGKVKGSIAVAMKMKSLFPAA
jgi:putative sterol carrier protein